MINLLKSTFATLFFIYKNIFHLMFSKILIILSSIIVGILFIFPFAILFIVFLYFFPNTNYIIIDSLKFILTFFFIYFAFLNFKLLFIKLNLKYLENKKLKINFKNYFNFKLIFKFLKISFLIFVGILFISLIFLALGSLFVFIFGGIDSINNIMAINPINSFSIISLILTIFYILIILYFIYRVYFSIYIILEDDKKSVFKSIKKSIKKTQKNNKLFKFIGILLLFSLILLPINYLGQYINFNYKKLEYYIELKNKNILQIKLNNKEQIDYTFLNKEFGNYNREELVDKYNKNDIMNTIYFILHYLFIFGIFDLVVVNFYKREINL